MGVQPVYTIQESYDTLRKSKGPYFKLRREGEAPRLIKKGRRTPISDEAATAWRREREECDR